MNMSIKEMSDAYDNKTLYLIDEHGRDNYGFFSVWLNYGEVEFVFNGEETRALYLSGPAGSQEIIGSNENDEALSYYIEDNNVNDVKCMCFGKLKIKVNNESDSRRP